MLKDNDVRLVTYVPDNVLTPLLKGGTSDNYFRSVCTTRDWKRSIVGAVPQLNRGPGEGRCPSLRNRTEADRFPQLGIALAERYAQALAATSDEPLATESEFRS